MNYTKHNNQKANSLLPLCLHMLIMYNILRHIFYANSTHVLYAWRNEFLNDKFHSGLFIFLGSSLFYSYPEHLSVIYNNKNYGSLLYTLFITVQSS